MIAAVIIVVLSVSALVLLVRLALGPTAFDRLIAAQGLFICAALFTAQIHAIDPRWIDAALAIVLIGAALLAAGLKAVIRQRFGAPLGVADGDAP